MTTDRCVKDLFQGPALRVDLDRCLTPALQGWFPRTKDLRTDHGGDPADPSTPRPGESDSRMEEPSYLRVAQRWGPAEASTLPNPARSSEDTATLRLGSVRAWVEPEVERVTLLGDGGARGVVALTERRGFLAATPDRLPPSDAAVTDLYWMMGIATALLLGRTDRAVVHAGAIVAPDGGAWLVVGDAHAGKSTTCAAAIEGGWSFLSDDQVVLRQAAARGVSGDVVAEGWQRSFHLDEGWNLGRPLGRRIRVDPGTLGPGRQQALASIAGILLPVVNPDAATVLRPMGQADALVALLRQSPWPLADPGAGPRALELLRLASTTGPVFRVRLGLDGFQDRRRILTRLNELTQAGAVQAGAG